jgi:hypothetical protein
MGMEGMDVSIDAREGSGVPVRADGGPTPRPAGALSHCTSRPAARSLA